MKRQVSFCI